MMNSAEASKARDVLISRLSSGRIEEGIAFFEGNSTQLPEWIRLECLGNIKFYQRDIREAIEFYEAATLLAPEHAIPRYLYLAGVKNEREGNLVEAFKYYQATIEAEPSFVDAYVELGGLLVKVEDFEGALKCYEDAVRLEPLDFHNHENLKTVLMKLNEQQPGVYEEKLRAAKTTFEALRYNPNARPNQKPVSEYQW
jgi:tetratricopeptide (TPR) repeat protein